MSTYVLMGYLKIGNFATDILLGVYCNTMKCTCIRAIVWMYINMLNSLREKEKEERRVYLAIPVIVRLNIHCEESIPGTFLYEFQWNIS